MSEKTIKTPLLPEHVPLVDTPEAAAGKHRSIFLRSLKLAYKLHQHGVSPEACLHFLDGCHNDPLAALQDITTATTPDVIWLAAFGWPEEDACYNNELYDALLTREKARHGS